MSSNIKLNSNIILNTQKFLHLFFAVSFILFVGCRANEGEQNGDVQDLGDRITTIEGALAGPEAVQYDPDQDVYFVSNFNGEGTAADSNGFITRAQANGTIDSLKFITATENSPLHAPRGMYITGDTLFVADVKGVHAFNKRTGKQIRFMDLTNFEPGFLNDVAVDLNGTVYVTDSVHGRVYRINGPETSIAVDTLEHPPNGIIFDESNNRLILAPWDGGQTFQFFTPDNSTLQTYTSTETGGNFDGIEPLNGSFLVSSQKDSSLYTINSNQKNEIIIKTAPQPADIAIDTRRNRAAVPYISLNRVDIWELSPDNK